MSAFPFVYLASQSPRRQALLDQIGVAYQVLLPADAEAAEALEAVLCADTTVVVDSQILGKPANASEAKEMLSLLSGKTHQVLTAVAIGHNQDIHLALSRSRVKFAPMTAADIQDYVASQEPMGKAGAYAIQGRASAFISHVSGSYSGIMGLPLYETSQLLKQIGVV